MSDPSGDANKYIRDALAALERKDRAETWRLARQAALIDPKMEQPWLILASLAKPGESIAYIQRALDINPHSQNAVQAMQWALQRLQNSTPETAIDKQLESEPIEPEPEKKPSEVELPKPETSSTTPQIIKEELTALTSSSAQHNTSGARIDPSKPYASSKKLRLTVRERVILWVLVGIFLAGVGGLYLIWPDISSLFGFSVLQPAATIESSNTSTSIQAALVTAAPTPRCSKPILSLGTKEYRIDSISGQQGSITVIPADDPNKAYWLEGTVINFVFGISSSSKNLRQINQLQPGDPAVITWSDCTKEEFEVKTVESTQIGDLSILDQSTGGITVYILDTDSNSLVVTQAGRPVVKQPTEPMELPTENLIQLDVQFNYDLPTPDPQSVVIGLILTNQGTVPVTITNSDISLTVEGESPVFPRAVEPELPIEISPTESFSLVVTFPKPLASISILNVLNITLDYYIQ